MNAQARNWKKCLRAFFNDYDLKKEKQVNIIADFRGYSPFADHSKYESRKSKKRKKIFEDFNDLKGIFFEKNLKLNS